MGLFDLYETEISLFGGKESYLFPPLGQEDFIAQRVTSLLCCSSENQICANNALRNDGKVKIILFSVVLGTLDLTLNMLLDSGQVSFFSSSK